MPGTEPAQLCSAIAKGSAGSPLACCAPPKAAQGSLVAGRSEVPVTMRTRGILSRHPTRFSRFRGTVQQGPVQRQETQIVRPCK